MAVSLHQGVYTAGLGLLGAGAVVIAPNQSWIGYSLMAAAMLVFLWGIRINGRHLWERGGAGTTMPLYLALRWLVQDSTWAANYRPEDDDQWVLRGDRELQSALSMGRIKAWGYFKPRLGEADPGVSEIPTEFWRRAQWNSHHIVGCEPPTHIWRDSADGGGQYRRVVLDEASVKAVWPKRSRWAALKGRSPVERLGKAFRLNGNDGYEAIWRAQDACYQRIARGEPHGAFGAVFDSPTPSQLDDD